MKRKVLIITPFLMHGGVERSLITALSGIDYEHYDVTLYLYKNDLSLLPQVPNDVHVIKGFDNTHYYIKPYFVLLHGLNMLVKLLHIEGLASKLSVALSNYIYNKKVQYPKKKYFKNQRFDVIISYCLHLGTEMALKLNAEKYYLFLHNSHTDYHVDIFEKCYPFYNSLIAVSEGVKDVYSSAYPHIADKIKVIDNYVNANDIIKKSKQYNIKTPNKKDCFVICTCGRLANEKGFDLAVEAAMLLKKWNYNFLWYFVGDGNERENIEKLIKEKHLENYIQITGLKENPFPYIAASDIYVQSSYEEAQPLVLLEAMILGRPIVSTKTVGGVHILETGKKGVLTGINGESIAEGIVSLITNPEKLHSFENLCTLENNNKERQIYIDKWDKLLSL